ncbi:hypothetical protein [Arthrobacter sp.]|uniref:hypothetical protein n=1 Tax=Arthrobacter sp. TaxID=1667 RepID=UPI0026DEC517|nr:hypothetical protein [Arthrobacter sp.]MDO5751549.1 hypothetical protein [Arthrobacter sp.]
MNASVVTTAEQTTLRRDPTVRFRRTATAMALPVGILLQVAANTVYALGTMDGGSDQTGAGALELYSSNTSAWRICIALAMVGSMLIVAGIPAALRVLRPTRPKLSLAAGLLMAAGYMAYVGIVAITFLEIALAVQGVDAGAAIDASEDYPAGLPFFLLFVAGNLVGTLLLGFAVLLSRQLPWITGALIIAWPVLHITGLIVGTEWFAVSGGIVETIGLGLLAAAALRLSDAQWVARG